MLEIIFDITGTYYRYHYSTIIIQESCKIKYLSH